MMLKDNMWRQRRMAVPKRTSELIALVALSSTLFLFLHTRVLHSRLREMEVRLQPGDNDISGNQLSSGRLLLGSYANLGGVYTEKQAENLLDDEKSC
ncbi:hypothetical protein PV325_007233 [Microctonus aethiopoides]|nr:hypothetical protein PV325_007233 [Microctonus aethiopoides]